MSDTRETTAAYPNEQQEEWRKNHTHYPATAARTCPDCSPSPMSDTREAAIRVLAFLDEMDRVDSVNRGAAHYADTIYGLNDIELTRADLRALLSPVPVSTDVTELIAGQWAFGSTESWPGHPSCRVLVFWDRGAWTGVERSNRWAVSQLTDIVLVTRPVDAVESLSATGHNTEWAVEFQPVGYAEPVRLDMHDEASAIRHIENPPLWNTYKMVNPRVVYRVKAGPWVPSTGTE